MLEFRTIELRTIREKIKHKMLQRKWNKQKKKMNRKRSKTTIPKSVVKIAVIIVFFVSMYFPIKNAVDNSKIESGEIQTMMNEETTKITENNQIEYISLKRHLGEKTSAFLQHTALIEDKIDTWHKTIKLELESNAIANVHSEAIEEIIKEIEQLDKMSINKLSSINEHDKFCKEYYKEVKSYFEKTKLEKLITTDIYNELVNLDLQTKKPIDNLIELLEDGNFEFSVEEKEDRKNVKYTYDNRSIH